MSELQCHLRPDGSLRDIYAFDADEALWDRFLTKILTSGYRREFWHGQLPHGLPANFSRIKQLQKTDPTTLKLFVGSSIQVNCHFFTLDEIELDIAPHEVQTAPEQASLVEFMSWLSRTLKRVVYLTHEGAPNDVILEIDCRNV